MYELALKFLMKKEVWIGILIIVCLSFGAHKIYGYGYNSAENKYIKDIAEINRKSAELISKQIEDHNRFVNNQSAALKSLQEENEKLEQIIKENESEASNDPDAKRPALGKSSILRLNRIR